jgi:eukaryotic-like serine/threonine-protein kinase
MIPKKLGRFEIVREIGRGAMGQVFLAHDPTIERQVAIKTIVLAAGTPEQEARETSRRFLREAQAAGRLLHPNIVTIFDVGEENGVSFIAMEFIDGVSLDRHARPGALLSPSEVFNLIVQAAGALDHAHAAGVIHRDVKPANLMRLADGTLKITDFGLAKDPTANLTQAGVLLGTPSYMSPEQIQGRPLDGRSDLFSLGVVLYELLTGVRPFDADSISTIIYRVLYEDPRPAPAHNPALPPEINLVLGKALAKSPERRYASGAAFVADLGKAFSMLAPETLARPFPRPVPVPPSARPAPAAGPGPTRFGPGSAPSRPGAATGPAPITRRSGGAPARAPRPTAAGAARPAASTAPNRDAAQPSLLAHHPFKIAALALTVIVGLVFFPRGANRSEPQGRRPMPAAEGPVQAAGMGAAPAAADRRVSVPVETKPAGAAVSLDNIPLAEPRVVLALDDPKTHDIRGRSGCLEASAEMTAAELAAASPPLVLELRARKPVVAIASSPAGARLFLDGHDTGKTTPVEMEFDACERREVELRLENHKPWHATFDPDQGIDAFAATLGNVSLEAIPRGTVVFTRPKGYGFEVWAGDRRIGKAGEPIELTEGRHALVLRNDDVFLRENATVTVAGGRAQTPATVLPELGTLTVQAQPSNCKVYVDGVYVDVTPVLDKPVAAGGHHVKVVFVPNGATREMDVSIAAGKPERVVVKF